MAVAAPTRRSSAAPALAPSRTSAPPRRKPKPARAQTAAPARPSAPRRKPARAQTAAPARRAPAPARRPAQRPRTKPKRATGGQLIPLAVGRTAATVRHLPDSGLIVRMTRGRAWIAVLGLLLVGIVALNVVTLSFAATSGKIDEQITELDKELSVLGGRQAQLYSTGRIRAEGAEQGLAMPTVEAPHVIDAGPGDVAKAAARLAAAGG